MRLNAGLHIGKVTVTDIETAKEIDVHLVDGEIIVLATVAKAYAETIMANALQIAAQKAN